MILINSGALQVASDRRQVSGCIEIIVPGETFRLTTFASATTIEESSFIPTSMFLSMNDIHELQVVVEAEHPLAKRWLAGTLPNRQIKFRLFERHQIDQHKEVIHRWQGDLVDGVFDGRRVVLRAESPLARALRRTLPLLTTTRCCQHRLFDSGCRLAKTDFAKRAIIVALSVYDITLDASFETEWLPGGDILHIASGEHGTIIAQAKSNSPLPLAIITLQAKLYSARLGDAVELLPGCDREAATCRDKFNNIVNFGGFPQLEDLHNPTK